MEFALARARRPGPHTDSSPNGTASRGPRARPNDAPRPPGGDDAPRTRPAIGDPPVRALDLPRPNGPRPVPREPVILTVEPSADYALLDSGAGEKLERYGPLTVRRPENQAIWQKRLPDAAWDGADAIFTGDTDEEGTGRWRFPNGPLGETWPLVQEGVDYLGRFTSYRHVGVFPEQAVHWRSTEAAITAALAGGQRPVRMLNLFGYTGVASLLGARAGAEVTHVDASKKAIAWARENQEVAGLESSPIRWICEDAVRYAEREVKRGSRYDVILLDPPRFGRGPKGEVWQLFEDLPYLLSLTRALLSDRPLLVILTAYSIRASFYALSALTGEAFRGLGGTAESGELVIREAGDEPRLLSTSLFCRWTPDHV
ncbi:class I SAM-dependent rRNA methyltransferase [Aurantimonas aggregata]|uniref:Class I SAM-dependent rRNA methyltransferase n=1 Tax=Aurantimonas aggregata TaxID=2047720 RepID=A0A6L9MFP0_9HYPH|nr:class I SAM-dependent methyltransferase [Aurantimonas aggregata]NDV86410.1 class I SAM-dependent rRNA methyltransferase [Aurantimonas aggregata]